MSLSPATPVAAASAAQSPAESTAAADTPVDCTVVPRGELSLRQALPYTGVAVAAFHLAYQAPTLSWLMIGFLWALAILSRLQSDRAAFYLTFTVGLACYTPHLLWFYTIFKGFAICLWMVLPFFAAVFVYLARLARRRLPPVFAMLVLPVLWLGLEYFRCELWPLRFGWLTPTLAFADHPPTSLLYHFGSFGFAALLMAAVTPLTFVEVRRAKLSLGYAAAGLMLLLLWAAMPAHRSRELESNVPPPIRLTGVQTETMFDTETLAALEAARLAHPETDLFVLSENAFTGRVPDAFRDWCRTHRAWLIGGGSDLVSQSPRRKYNTAFVVDPQGQIAFQQAKSMPIQFFDDGLPAQSQAIWQSPLGPLGLCICYDLSFTRITDQFAGKGAELMIVPTMDALSWGAHQHWLHTRVAPIRAAEYGLPIFRLASSGISQAVDDNGRVTATASFPGRGAILHAKLRRAAPATHLPLDRYLAPLAVTAIPLFILFCIGDEIRRRWRRYQTAAVGKL